MIRYNNRFTDDEGILKRWTEYCNDLHNYNIQTDDEVIDTVPAKGELETPILRSEVESAVLSSKKGKPSGADNIPAEMISAGGDCVIDTLHSICQRIWETYMGIMTREMDDFPSDSPTQERKSTPMRELQNDKPDIALKKGHAPHHPESIEGQSGNSAFEPPCHGCRKYLWNAAIPTLVLPCLLLFPRCMRT